MHGVLLQPPAKDRAGLGAGSVLWREGGTDTGWKGLSGGTRHAGVPPPGAVVLQRRGLPLPHDHLRPFRRGDGPLWQAAQTAYHAGAAGGGNASAGPGAVGIFARPF